MKKAPRQTSLPAPPRKWREEVSGIVRAWRDHPYRKAAEKIIEHSETETALRCLMAAAKKNNRNFGPREFAMVLHACACEVTPSPGYSFRDKRKALKLLSALDVLAEHPDIHFILDPREEGFYEFGNGALLPGIEAARKFLHAFAYPPAHRPPDFPQITLALSLGKLFKAMVGSECRPAIDALLSATFGPHGEVSKILDEKVPKYF
jgi:hypothetical protein